MCLAPSMVSELGQQFWLVPWFWSRSETVPVTVVATWTDAAMAHFAAAHVGAKSISVDLSNLNVDLAGISLSLPSKITIPNVPLS